MIPLTLSAEPSTSAPRSSYSTVHPSPPISASGDLISAYSVAYSSSETLKEALKQDVSKKLADEAVRFDPDIQVSSLLTADKDSSTGRRGGAWAIVLSALVPGAGEIYMGYYKRGVALVATDALAWTGYFYYHDKGLDSRKAYERFADEHWDFDRWIDFHPDVYPLDVTFAQLDSIGRAKWGTGSTWPAYHPWIYKSEDKQGYYEVIGKYDWFISGWSDFDPDLKPHHTDLRTQYRSMRKESNDQLKTADRFIYLSLAARVFSLVQTIFLSRSPGDDSSEISTSTGKRFDITFQPKGIFSAEFTLEYRF